MGSMQAVLVVSRLPLRSVSMKVWIDPDGGYHYHKDPRCKAILDFPKQTYVERELEHEVEIHYKACPMCTRVEDESST